MLLYDIIARGATEYPERTAIIFRDSPINYGALAAQVNRLADALHNRGIGEGDRVAVLLPNCPSFTFAYFATAAIGGVCVPANPLLKPAELTHIWGDSDAKMVITATPFLAHTEEAAKELPHLESIVNIASREETPEGILTLAELMQEADPAFNVQSAIRNPQSNDPAVCI